MKLYKYRDNIERDCETLKNNKLFAPDKQRLNDPAEMCFDDSEFLRFLRKHKKYSATVQDAFDGLKDFVKTKSGIFSLSKDVDNELLWAYYANGHKGFCIEYDLDVILESYNYGLEIKDNQVNSFPLVHCIDVDYQSDYPAFNLDYLKMKDRTNALRCIAGTKSKRWETENEVRLIFNKHGFTEIDYRAVTGIYFGVRFSDSSAISDIMNKFKGRGIKYYQMKFVEKSYNLRSSEIKDEFASTPKYIANRLSYDDIPMTGVTADNNKFKKLAIKALEYVSQEPCIYEIVSCYITSDPKPLISIQAYVNEDFKIFPIKYYRFDIVDNQIKLRRFQI